MLNQPSSFTSRSQAGSAILVYAGRKGRRMLMKLDPAWLMMAIATVSVLSYFFGAALDALRRDDRFGSFGNAIVMSRGFFLTILAANYRGHVLHGLHLPSLG